MSGIVEEFISSLGPEVSKKLSSTTNIDQNTIQNFLPVIAPMILGRIAFFELFYKHRFSDINNLDSFVQS